MAKSEGITYYYKLNKHELAEKLGIELPEKRIPPKKARPVEIVNDDGTTTTYPSISKAARALRKHAMQLYAMAVSDNNVRFV